MVIVVASIGSHFVYTFSDICNAWLVRLVVSWAQNTLNVMCCLTSSSTIVLTYKRNCLLP